MLFFSFWSVELKHPTVCFPVKILSVSITLDGKMVILNLFN